MGSGGMSTRNKLVSTIQQTNINPPNTPIQQQVPDANNTPVTSGALDNISAMSDNELAQLYIDSQLAQLPNQLNDISDQTQKFVFQAGLNEKPLVLDSAQFDQYLKDNNISQNQILARSVNSVSYRNQMGTTVKLSGDQVIDMIKYSRFNYIGGKVGGQVYGAGTYLEMNGGRSTGYGYGQISTMQAVLNPATAKVIGKSDLQKKALAFANTHPQFRKVVGQLTFGRNSNASIYALAMGYNVIADRSGLKGASGDYYNVIDRKALVIKK